MSDTKLDRRSFALGMVTAFCECVCGGCKRLALSPPLSRAEYDAFSAECEAIIEKHGLIHYHEANLDRPEGQRCDWILIAGKREAIDEYLALRQKGLSPLESLKPFHALLSYDQSRSVQTGYDAWRELFMAD